MLRTQNGRLRNSWKKPFSSHEVELENYIAGWLKGHLHLSTQLHKEFVGVNFAEVSRCIDAFRGAKISRANEHSTISKK